MKRLLFSRVQQPRVSRVRNALGMPAIFLLACLTPMLTAPQAIAHDADQTKSANVWNAGQGGCVDMFDEMNHNQWLAVTYSKWSVRWWVGYWWTQSCARDENKAFDGIRINIEHYINGDGFGHYECLIAWGIYNNPGGQSNWAVGYNGDISNLCGGFRPGRYTMDTGHSVRMENLLGPGDDGHRGGWIRQAVSHTY